MDYLGVEFTVLRAIDGGWKTRFDLTGKRPRTKDIFGSRGDAIRIAKQDIEKALGKNPRRALSWPVEELLSAVSNDV
jgi:hypothetical protein